MSKIAIVRKIFNGVYTIRKCEDRQGYIWNVLALIIKEDQTVLDGYIYCTKCNTVLRYNGIQTSNLQTHTCCLLYKSCGLTAGEELNESKEESFSVLSFEDSSTSSLAHSKSQNEDPNEKDISPVAKKIKHEPSLEISDESADISEDPEFIALQSSSLCGTDSAVQIEKPTTVDDEESNTTISRKPAKVILQKIIDGIYTTTDKPNGRSFIWNVLAYIVQEDKTILYGYVYCRRCHIVLRYTGSQLSNLCRHRCCQEHRDSVLKSTNAEDETETTATGKETRETCSEIASQIQMGIYSLTQPRKGRRYVWNIMDEIRKKDGSILENFVYCRECCRVLKYNSVTLRYIHQHKCYVEYKKKDWATNGRLGKSNKICNFSKSSKETNDYSTEEDSLDEYDQFEADEIAMDETRSHTSTEDGIEPKETSTQSFMEEDIQISKCFEDGTMIAEKITKGIYTTRSKNHKSYIWKLLAEIQKKDGTILKDHVYCRKCRGILINSPSNLAKHICCRAFRKLATLATHFNDDTFEEDFFKPTFSMGNIRLGFEQEATPEDKTEAAEACEAWLYRDCRPCSVIKDPGFVKLAKFFIKMGAIYGSHLDVTTILPDASRINRYLQTVAQEKKLQIQDSILGAVKSGTASASIDMWRDHYINRNFIGVMIHYQQDCKFFNLVLGLKSMDPKKSSASDVSQQVMGIFEDYDIEDIQDIKFIYSIGESSTIIAEALEHCPKHLKSSSHLLTRVLDKSFEDTKELQNFIKHIQEQTTLEKNQRESSGWLAFYSILKSVTDNISKPSISNEDKSEQHSNIDMTTVKTLSDLCKAFEIVLKRLTQCNSPSLCFVIPSITKISKICSPKVTDDPAVAALKKNIVKYLDSIWKSQLTIWHKAAFFLYPPMLCLHQHQPEDDLKEIKNFCQTGMEKYTTEQGIELPSISQTTSTSDLDDVKFFFFGLMDDPDDMNKTETSEQEVNRYTREVVPMRENFDLLHWWKSNETKFPRLSLFAIQIHSLPASSAMAEEAFSLAGQLITENLNQLQPKFIDNILFLNSYHKNFTH